MTRNFALEVPEQIRGDFSIEEYIERLLFEESMERGRQQYRAGKTLTHEEAVKRFAERWPKPDK